MAAAAAADASLPRHDTHLNTRMFAIGRRRRHHLTWAQQRTGAELLLESEDAAAANQAQTKSLLSVRQQRLSVV